jgi:hypothetical protein
LIIEKTRERERERERDRDSLAKGIEKREECDK